MRQGEVEKRCIAALGVLTALLVSQSAVAQSWEPGPLLTTASTGDRDYFARALAVDAGRVLVGAYGEKAGEVPQAGAAYLYSGTGLGETARLAAAMPAQYFGFGHAVALRGSTALFGESRLDDTSVHVLELFDGAWTETQLIHEADSTFGWDIRLQADTAVIASPKSGADVGKVHVYRKASGTWTESQELSASDAMESDFFSLGLDFDGETIVVGAPGNALYPGRHGVYVYAKSGEQFVEQQHLVYSTERDLYFGGSVSVSGDTLAIGATFGEGPGEGLIYVRTDGQWTLQQSLTDPAAERFGSAAYVKGDTAWFAGSTGAQGSLYIYRRSEGVWSLSQKLDVPSDERGGFTASASGGTLAIGQNDLMTTGFVQVYTNAEEEAKAGSSPPGGDSAGGDASGEGGAVDSGGCSFRGAGRPGSATALVLLLSSVVLLRRRSASL